VLAAAKKRSAKKQQFEKIIGFGTLNCPLFHYHYHYH
jgi:hypothetical protein